MIALVGQICSGKSFLAKELQKRGFKIFNADIFVEDLYFHNLDFVNFLRTLNLGYLIEDNKVSKPKIKALLKTKHSDFFILERIVHTYIWLHLHKHVYDFVELPVLNGPYVDFSVFFSHIINIDNSDQQRWTWCQKRGVDKSTFELINEKNSFKWGKIAFFKKVPIVNISWINQLNEAKVEELLQKVK